MYVTTNLLMSGAALTAKTPWDQITNDVNFSFDSVSFAGGYSTGTINLAGLAMADNPTEAVSFTQIAVPEPAMATLGLAATGILAACRKRPSVA